MYLDNDPQKKPVKLESGDRCFWYMNAGTVGFMRGDERLKHEGDDKFLLRPPDLASFSEIMNMLAETHNLTVGIDREDTRQGIVVYRFK